MKNISLTNIELVQITGGDAEDDKYYEYYLQSFINSCNPQIFQPIFESVDFGGFDLS